MKHVIVLAALLAAGPALAVNIVLKPAPEPDEQSPARPPTLDVRHMQVIRCIDAKGKLILQGGPCLPTTADAASAAAPEVIELSALPPRPPASLPRAAPQEPEMSPFVKGALNGAWKLALLVLVCYALWRFARALRDRRRENEVRVETRRHQPRRVL